MAENPKPKNFKDWSFMLIMTWGGLGLLPKAPGTFGTLGGVMIFALLVPLKANNLFWLLGLAAFLTVVCGLMGGWMEGFFQREDPPPVVIDEVAGYLVSAVVLVPANPLYVGILAFVFFRFFDILKPFPIKHLERIPSGWGVVLDDIGAGIMAALVLNGIFYFV